jgi:hypothetical protein
MQVTPRYVNQALALLAPLSSPVIMHKATAITWTALRTQQQLATLSLGKTWARTRIMIMASKNQTRLMPTPTPTLTETMSFLTIHHQSTMTLSHQPSHRATLIAKPLRLLNCKRGLRHGLSPRINIAPAHPQAHRGSPWFGIYQFRCSATSRP